MMNPTSSPGDGWGWTKEHRERQRQALDKAREQAEERIRISDEFRRGVLTLAEAERALKGTGVG